MILEFVFGFVVFLYSVIIHEVSHGLMARSMGDDTAERQGRLSFNPLRHLDLFGSVLLPIFFLVFSQQYLGRPLIFGYAKPVPHNPLNLRDQKYGSAKVALAGPASNFLLVLLFGIVIRSLPQSLDNTLLPGLLGTIIWINLLLGVFNLIPIQPLDGHWLLFTLLPRRFAAVKYFLAQYGVFLFIILIMILVSTSFLTDLINFLFSVIVGAQP